MKKRWLAGFALVTLFLLGSCAEVAQVGTTLGQQTGRLSAEDKARLDLLAAQVAKASQSMTEEEEYYLGRAVAADILGRYPLYQNERLTKYIHELGKFIALSSDVPLTFGGYHFAILDTEEINAFACPGGIILITRGMLKQPQNEEQLAALLAHEVAHVNHRDGVAAIEQARWAEVVMLLGRSAAKKLGGADLARMVSLFEGSVGDVVKTLLVTGYSREQESAADLSALGFMNRAGYDPRGLPEILSRLSQQKAAGTQGIFATHPGMADRLAQAQAIIAQKGWSPVPHQVRDGRFQTAMK